MGADFVELEMCGVFFLLLLCGVVGYEEKTPSAKK
jgi:hypothetical protein